MKNVLLHKVGDTTNGLSRHAEIMPSGNVFIYEHYYRKGVADSKLVVLYADEVDRLLPIIEQERNRVPNVNCQ